jgi:hypothetical protein
VSFVVVGLVDSAVAQPQSTNSNPPSSSLPSPATERQERKLDLEIRRLEEETSTAARVRSWLPAGSIFAALAAGGFGAYQYFRDRRRESAIRVEEQFSENLRTIAEYVHENNYPSAGLLSALTSLKELVELTKDPQRYRSRVTSVIAMAASQDVDFEDPRQARFDPLCLDQWPDYGRWLSGNPPQQQFLRYRYLQALRSLATRYSRYFQGMRRLEGRTLTVNSSITEPDFLHFQQLLAGYHKHLQLQTPEARRAGVEEFGSAIGNRLLAQDLLGAEATDASLQSQPRTEVR